MIPTMIVFGLVLGRWWKSTLLAAALGWPLLLLATGVAQQGGGPLVTTLAAASLLAVANAGLGVVIHQLVARVLRAIRRSTAPDNGPGHLPTVR